MDASKRIEQWSGLQFGMFIHFGLYSMLGGVWQGKRVTDGYSEQIQKHGELPRQQYEQLAQEFNPDHFNPDAIVQLAKAAGMKYIVLTAKHHDGFNLFHTRHSLFNVVDASPYGKDIVAQLSEACRRQGLKFGVYFSWIDWHFPNAAPMSDHNSDVITPEHMAFNLAQIEELLTNYGPMIEVWFDMGAPTTEQSKQMADLVHRLQPEALINGRIWNNQGDFAVLGDNEIPQYQIDGPWQTPASIYHATWGYRSWQERTDLAGKIAEQVDNLQKVRDLGGNYLLNIGPRGDGSLVEFEVDVLRGIGRWINENGDRTAGTEKRPGIGQRIVLQDQDAQILYRLEGAEYYSCKPVATKKRWVVRLANGEEVEVLMDLRA